MDHTDCDDVDDNFDEDIDFGVDDGHVYLQRLVVTRERIVAGGIATVVDFAAQ